MNYPLYKNKKFKPTGNNIQQYNILINKILEYSEII